MSVIEESIGLDKKVADVIASEVNRPGSYVGNRHSRSVMDRIAEALREKYGDKRAEELAFHISDWRSDAAFIVALHLCPEKFTPSDIRWGIELMLVHAPNHLMAAANLAGCALADTWDLGVQVEPALRLD